MEFDQKAVKKVAKLARLAVSEQDVEHYQREISGILKWVEQLSHVDTDNVPQMTSVSALKLPWRKDIVTEGSQQEAILKNASGSEYGCFSVPKVIE